MERGIASSDNVISGSLFWAAGFCKMKRNNKSAGFCDNQSTKKVSDLSQFMSLVRQLVTGRPHQIWEVCIQIVGVCVSPKRYECCAHCACLHPNVVLTVETAETA